MNEKEIAQKILNGSITPPMISENPNLLITLGFRTYDVVQDSITWEEIIYQCRRILRG